MTLIRDEDLRVDIYTAWPENPVVKVTHLPTGLSWSCTRYRSVADNRETAISQLQKVVDHAAKGEK